MTMWHCRNTTGLKVLALCVDNTGLIPDTISGPQTILPGESLEYYQIGPQNKNKLKYE